MVVVVDQVGQSPVRVPGPGHAADDLALQPGLGPPLPLPAAGHYLVPVCKLRKPTDYSARPSQPWC